MIGTKKEITQEAIFIGKILLLTLNEQEEKAIDKIISAIANCISFEAVWNMDSDSCHSSVMGVIYNLRKKIEPDGKNPIYIKTVLGVGYKFSG